MLRYGILFTGNLIDKRLPDTRIEREGGDVYSSLREYSRKEA